MIDIKGMDKSILLRSLWLEATIVYKGAPALDLSHAVDLVSDPDNEDLAFNTVLGRKIDCTLRGDTLDPTAYDAANGPGRAAKAVELARATSTDMQEKTDRINVKIFAAFDLWKKKYKLEPAESGYMLAMVLTNGPDKLKGFLSTGAAFTNSYAREHLKLDGAALDAFAEEQMARIKIFGDVLELVMEIMPDLSAVGGAIVLRGGLPVIP